MNQSTIVPSWIVFEELNTKRDDYKTVLNIGHSYGEIALWMQGAIEDTNDELVIFMKAYPQVNFRFYTTTGFFVVRNLVSSEVDDIPERPKPEIEVYYKLVEDKPEGVLNFGLEMTESIIYVNFNGELEDEDRSREERNLKERNPGINFEFI